MFMKKSAIQSFGFHYPFCLFFSFVLCLASTIVFGQQAEPTASLNTASLNKKLGVYVFPAKDQKADQQQKDEAYCYDWAIKNSGVDPLNMQPVKVDTVKAPSKAQGTVVGGAKGAAAGVAIGAIAGDAGKGAAIGAAAGGMAGRRAAKKGQKQAEQQTEQKAQAATQGQIDAFTKAYKACLTGKGYTVQ
jgi:hypothetical protein